MTMTAERQMELTLPMVPDIEIAAARSAACVLVNPPRP